MHRRRFLQTSLTTGAGLAFPALLRAALPNAVVSIAVIGVSRNSTGGPGRGSELALALAGLPGVELAYLCDVDEGHLGKAMAALAQKGQRPKAERDFRRLLADPHLDAVVIATPDHWHVPAALLACAAGKHVYVETPCSYNPAESKMLVASAQQHQRVVQHGTQRRSWPALQEAMAKLQGGAIGRLLSAKAVYFAARPTIGRNAPSAPPPGLDWELWQGPAPDHPYQANLLPHNWRWFWHWGTGEMGSNGIHLLDLCRWGLNLSVPVRTSSGGVKSRFPDDQETPDSQTAVFDFAGPKPWTVTCELRSWAARTLNDAKYDVAFFGEEGSLLITGSAYAIYDLAGRETARGAGPAGVEGHLRNWLDAIRGNGKLTAPIEEGAASTLMCHLANIAWRTNHTLLYNPARERIISDLDADALWERKYRPGWTPII